MNEFQIQSEIGKGSFATVYKAIHIPSSSIVAIKTVLRKKLNRKLAENLETEIAILNRARHRNVVALHNKTQSEMHLIMEYCVVGDLSLFIKKKGKVAGYEHSVEVGGPWGGLDELVTRYFLGQLACAIEFLRLNNIVHRDLKPQNILLGLPPKNDVIVNPPAQWKKVSELPILKLGDFGFARALAFQSLASTLCGSPLYMAPEILKGEKYDAKTDLWSAGAIIYEMISGKPPFRAQNHIELLRKIEKGDGWIRFPDEEEHFQTREYHGDKILHRKSSPQVLGPNAALYVGSLGSSPRNPGMAMKVQSIPGDLKALVRSLLERNPTTRMSFEEFFIHPTVVECRLLDARARQQSIPEPNVDKQEKEQESVKTAPVNPDTVAKIINLHGVPFPGYEMDPNWLQKVMVKPLHTSQSHTVKHRSSDQKLKIPEGLLNLEPAPATALDADPEQDSPISFGSFLDSIEFTSDEDKDARTNPEPIKESKEDFEDFEIIETKAAEIKWNLEPEHPHLLPTTSIPQPIRAYGSSPKSIHTPSPPGSIDRALVGLPKGRLFGTLRQNSNSFTTVSQKIPELDPLDLFGPIPYSIKLDALSPIQKSNIIHLNLATARALCVLALTNQIHNQVKESKPNTPSPGTAKYFNTLSEVSIEETMEMYVFSLGLFQYVIELAKKYQYETANHTEAYTKQLEVILQFSQDRFNESLDLAEYCRTENHHETSIVRPPERLIYETALNTSKLGAISELRGEDYVGFYKTSVLLLQALVQPNWESKECALQKEDAKVVQGFLDQLYVRLGRNKE